MNKRSRPKLSESDLELFNRVVADVKPLKFQEKSFIDKKNYQVIDQGGWHFSYLLNPKNISEKIQSFSHG